MLLYCTIRPKFDTLTTFERGDILAVLDVFRCTCTQKATYLLHGLNPTLPFDPAAVFYHLSIYEAALLFRRSEVTVHHFGWGSYMCIACLMTFISQNDSRVMTMREVISLHNGTYDDDDGGGGDDVTATATLLVTAVK